MIIISAYSTDSSSALQLNASRLPVWASIAQDYLAIMASSGSSERAFSSAGLTITRLRSRLQGDIVEALQGLKAVLRSDFVMRDPEPSSLLEEQMILNSEAEGEDDTHADFMPGGGSGENMLIEVESEGDGDEWVDV